MRVLVCDDDQDIVQFLTWSLEDLGCEVVAGDSGYAALDQLKAEAFDMVITDYHMTNGDGGMLSNYCSERGIPCIVVTGLAQDRVKPYTADETVIFGKIEFIAALHRLERDIGAHLSMGIFMQKAA